MNKSLNHERENIKLPEGWEIANLGDEKLFKVIMGQSPPSNTYNESGMGIPFMQGCAEFGYIYPAPRLHCNKPLKISEPMDILISVRAPVGEVNINDRKLCIGRGLAAIRLNSNKVDPWFLFYLLRKFGKKLSLVSSGSTFRAITKRDLNRLWIPLPPLPEQKRIAEILQTVDEGIEKVDQEIEHTERLKKGLMQRLLTRGIGHKEFKDSPIGKIPKEWEVVRLGEICQLERGRFAHRPRNDPNLYGGDIPFIQTGDIAESNGIIKKYKQTLNTKGLAVSKLFRAGTLVISIAGNIGDVGILSFDACFPDSIIGIKPDKQKIYPFFLLYMLKKFQVQLSFTAPRSTQRNINLQILDRFLIPLPPPAEQRKIVKILLAVDRKLELLQQQKERFQRIKKGLLSELLTGRRRVKVSHAEI